MKLKRYSIEFSITKEIFNEAEKDLTVFGFEERKLVEKFRKVKQVETALQAQRILKAGKRYLNSRPRLFLTAMEKGFQYLEQQNIKKTAKLFICRLKIKFLQKIIDKMYTRARIRRILSIYNKIRVVNRSLPHYRAIKLKHQSLAGLLQNVKESSYLLSPQSRNVHSNRYVLLSRFSTTLKKNGNCYDTVDKETCFFRWIEFTQERYLKDRLVLVYREAKKISFLRKVFCHLDQSRKGLYPCKLEKKLSLEKVIIIRTLKKAQANLISYRIRSKNSVIKKHLKKSAQERSLKLALKDTKCYFKDKLLQENVALSAAFPYRGLFDSRITVSKPYGKSNMLRFGLTLDSTNLVKYFQPIIGGNVLLVLSNVSIWSMDQVVCGIEFVHWNLGTKQFEASMNGMKEGKRISFFFNEDVPNLFFEQREYLIGIDVFLGAYLGKIRLVSNKKIYPFIGKESPGNLIQVRKPCSSFMPRNYVYSELFALKTFNYEGFILGFVTCYRSVTNIHVFSQYFFAPHFNTNVLGSPSDLCKIILCPQTRSLKMTEAWTELLVSYKPWSDACNSDLKDAAKLREKLVLEEFDRCKSLIIRFSKKKSNSVEHKAFCTVSIACGILKWLLLTKCGNLSNSTPYSRRKLQELLCD
eukprot:augustus_masked-scaffold_1-processed-gene-32.58-mRNA-1 protein AED:1.00 eAED:1.00 QI:0/-1/0/0/-1/1/1/0/638